MREGICGGYGAVFGEIWRETGQPRLDHASVQLEQLFCCWEGLGYHSRINPMRCRVEPSLGTDCCVWCNGGVLLRVGLRVRRQFLAIYVSRVSLEGGMEANECSKLLIKYIPDLLHSRERKPQRRRTARPWAY